VEETGTMFPEHIELIRIDDGRIMIFHCRDGSVLSVSFASEGSLVDALLTQHPLPIVLYLNTAYLTQRLQSEGFTTVYYV
jgi:hypothetical protein